MEKEKIKLDFDNKYFKGYENDFGLVSINDFINKFVSIRKLGKSEEYGFYPWLVLSQFDDERANEVLALEAEKISDIYKVGAIKVSQGAKNLIMVIDYEKYGNMKDDFITVINYCKGHYSARSVVYNSSNGKVIEYHNSDYPEVQTILQQFIQMAKSMSFKK